MHCPSVTVRICNAFWQLVTSPPCWFCSPGNHICSNHNALRLATSPHASTRSVSFSSISNHYSSCSTQTILLIHLASLLVWISTQPLSLKLPHTWFGHVTACFYTSGINFIEIQLLLPLQQSVVHFG